MFTLNKKILHGLKNLELAGYSQEVVEATGLLNEVSEVSTFVENLKVAVSNYNDAIYMKGTQEYTANIHQVNADVESAWVSVMKITEGLSYSADTALQQTAKAVYDVVAYFGNISRLAYDAKYGAVVSFLANITDEQAKALGIETFVGTLRDGNAKYVAVSAERKDYRKLRKAKVAEGRLTVEKSMSLLFDLVVTLAAVQGEDKFLSFANRVDELRIERADKNYSSNVEAAQQSEETDADKADDSEATTELEQEQKDSSEPVA